MRLRRSCLLLLILYRYAARAETRERCDPTHIGSQICETCPRGKYRPSDNNGVLVGTRRRECTMCPRGRYGETAGLTSLLCTAPCPAGKYSDMIGARTVDDCKLCPQGRYGSSVGLVSRACTAACPAGRYSSKFGLTLSTQCVACPAAYRGWQCVEDIVLRKGYFDSTAGTIGEGAHAYIDDNEDISEGASPLEFDSWDPIHKTYDPELENIADTMNSFY